MPNLTIRENGSETVFQVSDKSATIGRGEHNDVRIEDPRASKEHCRIVEQDGRWKMVDLESHNGTRVNGDFRNKAWLDHGDTIRIGQSEIRFGLEGRSRARAEARAGTDEEEAPPRRYQSVHASARWRPSPRSPTPRGESMACPRTRSPSTRWGRWTPS